MIGLITPELEAIKARLKGLQKEGLFKGTPYRYQVKKGYHELMSPFGVKMRLHQTGSLPFPKVLGMPYVDIPVEPGKAEPILNFYKRIMRSTGTIEKVHGKKAACVTMGPYQWTRFIETKGLDSYDNHTFHIIPLIFLLCVVQSFSHCTKSFGSFLLMRYYTVRKNLHHFLSLLHIV